MKNKLNETDTDFGKELVTKINLNGFSMDSYMPKEVVSSISQSTPKISKECIRELLEKIIAQYNMLHSDLAQIVAAYLNQTKATPAESPACVKQQKQLTIDSKPIVDMFIDSAGQLWAVTEKHDIRSSYYTETSLPKQSAYIFYKLTMPAKKLSTKSFHFN